MNDLGPLLHEDDRGWQPAPWRRAVAGAALLLLFGLVLCLLPLIGESYGSAVVGVPVLLLSAGLLGVVLESGLARIRVHEFGVERRGLFGTVRILAEEIDLFGWTAQHSETEGDSWALVLADAGRKRRIEWVFKPSQEEGFRALAAWAERRL